MKRKIAQKNSPPFEPNGGEFSKDVTNVCKGLAVALLLCHHAFTGSSEFLSTIVPDIIAGVNITASVGAFGKICVTIFLTLSGYGLYRKYSSDVRWEQAPRAFIYNSLIKLLVIYQFIYLLALPINVALGRSIMTIYGDKVPLVNAVVDFFGLSYLFQFLKLNPTMWYMSLAIVSVLLFPFLKKQTDRYGVVPLVLFAWLAHALASDELIRDFGAFLSGILIARYDLFERIRAYRPFGMVKEKNALLGGGGNAQASCYDGDSGSDGPASDAGFKCGLSDRAVSDLLAVLLCCPPSRNSACARLPGQAFRKHIHDTQLFFAFMSAIGVLEHGSGFDFRDVAGAVPGRVLSGNMAISIVPG
ncbi:acyltransferase [Anaerotruncus colihominis]|uniref:acyltransferase family protein n=1 Tax=Anaerotruncus colihominis TaxID=169435 RepID=UPI0026F0C442|nr:acyltransferase [Anaerotruncus colihominis]